MAAKSKARPAFDLGLDTHRPRLTFRLLDRQREHLDEMATALSKVQRRQISVSRLVRAAIARRLKHPDETAHSASDRAGQEPAFDLDLSEPGMPLQIVLNPGDVEDLDDMADRQGVDRSTVIRDAVDFLIAYYDRHKSLD